MNQAPIIDRRRLLEGMAIHVRGKKLWPSRSIRFMLDIRRRRELRKGKTELTAAWGNHDGEIIYICKRWYVGDSQPPVARLTLLDDYERDIASGKIEAKFLWPAGADKEDGRKAAKYWTHNILNRPYDYMAYPRIILKCLFGDWIKRAAGWTWAFFCTESCRECWLKGAGKDPWRNETPTPFTTEKRVESGELEDWTGLVMPV